MPPNSEIEQPAPQELQESQEALTDAQAAIQSGDTEQAEAALAVAQETLTEVAEEIAEETAPTDSQARILAILEQQSNQLANLSLAVEELRAGRNLEQDAAEIASVEAEAPTVEEVREANPATVIRSKLKNGWLSPFKTPQEM